jgi:PAS domain S-box-containing protein
MKRSEINCICQGAIDLVPVMIWIDNPNSFYKNRQWYDYTGHKPTGHGFSWIDAVHPEDREQFDAIYRDAYNSHKPFAIEFRFKDKNGNYRWHLNSGNPRSDNQGNFEGFVGSVIDIHERKQAEDALRISEHRYKTYVEAMPQMAFIANVEGNIIYYNQQWYDYVGGMEGTEGWGWKDKPIHHPDDLARAIKRWNESLQTGGPYEIEYRLRRYDGQYRWHLGRATAVRDSGGNIEFWLGTNTDIHYQKQTEEALQERGRELQKANEDLENKNNLLKKSNQLVENLMYIIAHDLTGPLTNMSLILDLMKGIADKETKDKLIGAMGDMVNQQRNILHALVELLESQSLDDVSYRKIDLEALASKILKEKRQSLNECRGELEFHFEEAPFIYHIQNYVFSILKNLVEFSIKHRSKDKPLKIDIHCTRKDAFVLLTLRDNGNGIEFAKYGKDIFKPFIRLSGKNKNTCMSLYLVKNLIENSGGHIEVESNIGEGTCFYCYLIEKEPL